MPTVSAKYAFDSELAAWAARMPSLDLSDVAKLREKLISPGQPSKEFAGGVRSTDHVVLNPVDGNAVRVRLLSPSATSPLPALLYVPGGGFVLPPFESTVARWARIAAKAEVTIAIPYYRLAPEHPFPAALLDVAATAEWLAAEAAQLGVDSELIGIGGDSAGGCLAAGVALLARDRGGVRFRFQYLGTPVLDDRLESHSMHAFVDTPAWARGSAQQSWDLYLRDGPTMDGREADGYAAPARMDDLSGLPPTYVAVSEFDPLRDEGIAYALRLLRAGVPTELHLFPGTFHGSIQLRSQVSERMEAEIAAALVKGLGKDA